MLKKILVTLCGLTLSISAAHAKVLYNFCLDWGDACQVIPLNYLYTQDKQSQQPISAYNTYYTVSFDNSFMYSNADYKAV
jgi:hypothetical protein